MHAKGKASASSSPVSWVLICSAIGKKLTRDRTEGEALG